MNIIQALDTFERYQYNICKLAKEGNLLALHVLQRKQLYDESSIELRQRMLTKFIQSILLWEIYNKNE